MNFFRLHPAVLKLLRYQAAAKLARIVRGFGRPRRMVLSIVAVLLTVVWLGQAVLGLLLREPADAEKLQVWLPLGLLAYTLWHVLKIACRAPIVPFEWTETEKELLGGAPLSRCELVMYRLASIGFAAVAKAACFSLVMLPDLSIWVAGFLGMFMGLIFVDLVRMVVEIMAYGLSRSAFLRFRVAILTIAGACVASALVSSLLFADRSSWSSGPASLVLLSRFGSSLADLRMTWIGILAMLPFHVFGQVILATTVSVGSIGCSLLAGLLVFAMVKVVVWFDRLFLRRRVTAERESFHRLDTETCKDVRTIRDSHRSIRMPYRFGGAGILAWRQLLGAFHYRTSVAISLLLPAVLSCITLLTPQSGVVMLIQILGSLIFYTFVLLPTALKFDFRRDVDRLSVIKSLPISPTAVTIGQLAVPVLLSTLFQMAVLVATMLVKPFDLNFFVAALIVLVPINVSVFAFENLVFMLYPYRMNQEGLDVFLRSILTFTAKGILFAVSLALFLGWALVSKHLASYLTPDNVWTCSAILFVTGTCLATCAAAAATTLLLARVYRGFDPSQDVPAMS